MRAWAWGIACAATLALVGCGEGPSPHTKHTAGPDRHTHHAGKHAKKHSVPKPARLDTTEATGTASYYHESKKTASGERFDPDGLTAAHRTLPFGTRIRVTNLSNNQAVMVRINDRGPFIRSRSIDLSAGAAAAIGMKSAGIARVRMEVVD